MLVLTRKPGEQILVGKEVKITVIRISPNTVRIGIDAPPDMNIVRAELLSPGDPVPDRPPAMPAAAQEKE